MLTSVAPAFARAIAGQVSDLAASGLAQSLFNCAQPLEHRGPVAFGVSPTTQRGGLVPAGGWNPSSYPGLFPGGSGSVFVEAPSVGGYHAGDWYSTLYGSPYFDLRTMLTQNLNTYQTPAMTVAGPANVENLTSQNITTINLTTDSINGEPINGRDGAAGPQGDRGADGGPGPGNFNFFIQMRGGGGGGNVFVAPQDNLRDLIRELIRKQDLLARGVRDLRRALKDLKIEGWPQEREVVFDATFDADACEVVPRKNTVKLRIKGLEGL